MTHRRDRTNLFTLPTEKKILNAHEKDGRVIVIVSETAAGSEEVYSMAFTAEEIINYGLLKLARAAQ